MYYKFEDNEGGICVPRMGVIIVSDFEMYYKLETTKGEFLFLVWL